MNWTLFDFIFAGLLLALPALAVLVAMRLSDSWAYRAGALLTAATGMALIWVTGAVGIIGGSGNDANLAFAAVLVTGSVGAVIVRLRASGLAHTLVAMAAVQTAIGIGALVMGLGSEGHAWPADVIGATAVFTGAWLTASALFRHAGRQDRVAGAGSGA